ncbi:MAG: SIS domain-containing protein [Bryobacteraceae bacterium]
MNADTQYQKAVREAAGVYESLLALEPALETAGAWCVEALRAGRKLLTCGNGGSAAEAQHLSSELVGKYLHDRPALAAISLNADDVLLTAIGNDYGYDQVFARQVRGLGKAGDILIVFTSSGNSPNVLRALEAAREMGLRSIAFLGRGGGKAKDLADCVLMVPHAVTARIQESHLFLLHALMDQIEAGR